MRFNMIKKLIVVTIFVLSTGTVCLGQQEADTSFLPVIDNPSFIGGNGPVVMIDEAHHNFHTAGERFLPFAELLRRDGYTVIGTDTPFSAESLAKGNILVISNALNERNEEDWSLPTPSAFTPDEIEAVRLWVEGGGALFLIADHMPFPGAASDLAAAFGIEFNNGFALDTTQRGPAFFRRSQGTLKKHAITNGRNDSEKIDSVASFTGQAFQATNADFEPLMVFDTGFVSLMPRIAWEFDDSTKILDIKGWCQGGVLKFGKGRVAVFGEAAMFTAQIAGEERRRFGMNSPEAPQNLQFLLNVIHWLTGLD